MSELLRDVDEMMRQERLKQIWQTYGNYIIGGILAIILAVAADQGYQSHRLSSAQATMDKLQAALSSPNPVEALQAYAKDNSGNAAAMARLLAVSKQTDASKRDETAATLLAVRNDARAGKDLRDLATVLWVRLLSADQKQDVDALLSALAPIIQNDRNPWAWTARIDAAALHADRKNDYAGAIALLDPMTENQGLPYTQSERAQALVQLYRIHMANQTPAASQATSKVTP